jgi:P-type Mg2+ transporter
VADVQTAPDTEPTDGRVSDHGGAPAAFWDQPLEQHFAALDTDANGLSAAEARRRLRQYGPNTIATRQRGALLRDIFSLFRNPLVIILLLASLISALLGDQASAVIIVVIVLFSVVLDFFQVYRSRKAVERLRNMTVVNAQVVRDGQVTEIATTDVVPGDIVLLAAGNLVPADALLLESKDLFLDEAVLTGESFPAEKHSVVAPTRPRGIAEAQNAVFAGTSVLSGTGRALVVVTGAHTEFGQIAGRLVARAPETEFERGMREFSALIARVVLLLVVFVFLVNLLFHRDPVESFLFAVALAVGLTPEFLPMIISVTLATGAQRMAREQVIVKQPAAIENFGSMDVLCSDKTGTLTEGHIVLAQYVDFQGKPLDHVLLLAALNSQYQTGLRNTMDAAIVHHEHPALDGYTKVDEVPFDFTRRRLSVVVEHAGQRLLITKGAPEGVLPACAAYEADGAVQPLDDAARQQIGTTFTALSAQGYRALAVAYREVPGQAAYEPADERDLTFVGFVAFLDPPRASARATLEQMRADGIVVKILTGDNDLVACKVCADVGLPAGQVVLGTDLERLSDPALGATAERTSVFARVSPEQKNRILEALRRRGHVVGFLGDGINDAPSLRRADVGISVNNAADVAKEAAQIVLLALDLRVLHRGVLEGRKSFGNVMKYILMATSSNFGNMFSMAGASLFLPFLPMLPTQILANNLLYDLAQVAIPTDNVDDAYVRKPRHWDVGFIKRFMLVMGPISSLFDFLTFGVMLGVFHAPPELFRTGWFMESLATQTLVIFVIRTTGDPFRSRPSRALTINTLVVLAFGLSLPFTPLGAWLHFVPPPALFFAFLAVAVGCYLALVQWVKVRFYRHYAV